MLLPRDAQGLLRIVHLNHTAGTKHRIKNRAGREGGEDAQGDAARVQIVLTCL
jgi:hypothetical protein